MNVLPMTLAHDINSELKIYLIGRKGNVDSSVIVNILEEQKNGIIIIDKYKKVCYTNKVTRQLLGQETDKLIGDYLCCKNVQKEKVNCQQTSKCYECIINRAIDNVIHTKESQIIDNIEIKKDCMELVTSLKISLSEEEYVLIELFELNLQSFQMELITKLVDRSKDIMFFKNNKMVYLYVNKRYADFLDREKDYIIGKTDVGLVEENLIDETLYKQCIRGDKKTLEEGYYHGIEKLGNDYYRVSKEKIDGGILGVVRNITNEVDAIKKSETDTLTGMYNRRKFEEEIKKIYLNRDENYYISLIDLDNLRHLNNQYGHIKGDKYLNFIAQVLKKQEDAMFFRIGGDEFVGLINSNKICPKLVLEKIVCEINELNLNPKLTISAGVSKLDINIDYEENYKIVDKILYEAKRKGKNKLIINYAR